MAHRYGIEESFSIPLPQFRTFTDEQVTALTEALAEEKKLTKSTQKGWKLTGGIAQQKALQHEAWRKGQVAIGKAATLASEADAKAMKILGREAVKHNKHLKKAEDADNDAIKKISQINGRYEMNSTAALPWS